MRRRWWAVTAITLLALTIPPAPSAVSGAAASISDTTPAPGEVITVTASGLQPSSPVIIYFLPEAQLGQFTADGSGSLRTTVRLPTITFDGPKQIVVTAIDTDGHYAYLPTNITVHGAAAAARLVPTHLTPKAGLRITATRFLPGTDIVVALFPEKVLLGQVRPGSDGSFSTALTMPADLFNGRHVIVVAGPNASGGYSYLTLEASVTGGIGTAPAVVGSAEDLADSVASTSTTSTSTTIAAPLHPTGDLAPATRGSSHGNRWLEVLVLVLLVLLVSAALIASWLRTAEGRRWQARRRAAAGHRR